VVIRPKIGLASVMGLALIFLFNTEFFSLVTIFILADRFLLLGGYMIKIILIGSICLWLLFYHPGWVLLAGFIYGCVYLLHKYNLTPAVSKDRADNLPPDFMTYEDRAEKEMTNTKFKEGFENDPKWQALAKKVGSHVDKARDIEEASMREAGRNIKNMQ